MAKLTLSSILMISLAFSGSEEQKVILKKIVIGDQTEDVKINVNTEVEDGVCTIVITRDGETTEYSFDLENEEGLKEIEKKIEELGLDLHVKALVHGDENKFFIDGGHGGGAFLGVHIQDLTDQLRTYFKVKGDGGVLISEVVEDSPAEKAGIKAGDVITIVGDEEISGPSNLQKSIRKHDPEEKVKITIVRNGRKRVINTTLGENERKYSWLPKKPDNDHRMMFFSMDEDIDVLKDGIKKRYKVMKKHGEKKDSLKEEVEALKEQMEELKKQIEELKKP